MGLLTCPSCRTLNLARIHRLWWQKKLSRLFPLKRYQCRHCHKRVLVLDR